MSKATASKVKEITPEYLWDLQVSWFREHAQILQNLQLESPDEAVSGTNPIKYDRKLSFEATHPGVLRHRRTDDAELLGERLKYALGLVKEIETLLDEGLTPSLLGAWGDFYQCFGYIESTFYAKGRDLGPLRAGQAGAAARSTHDQKRWVAHLLAKKLDEKRPRHLADIDVAKAIVTLLQGPLPPGYERSWFQKILRPDKRLKSTFANKRLSHDEVRRLVGEGSAGLPLIDIPFST